MKENSSFISVKRNKRKKRYRNQYKLSKLSTINIQKFNFNNNYIMFNNRNSTFNSFLRKKFK